MTTTTFEVAHFREQGVELAVFPLNEQFASKTPQQRDQFHAALRAQAIAAGFRCQIVTVWRNWNGTMGFIAERRLHISPVLRSSTSW